MSIKVQLSLSCHNLRDRDITSRSDPVCILYTQVIGGRWVEFGRTEQVRDSNDPVWLHKFVLEYRFQERQMLKFRIVDIDTKR